MSYKLPPLESVLDKGAIGAVREHIAMQDYTNSIRAKVGVERKFAIDTLISSGLSEDVAVKTFDDIVNQGSSGKILGFPYNTPSSTVSSATTSLFKSDVTDSDINDAYDRNPFAKPIVDGIINKGLKNGFKIFDPTETSKEIDIQFQEIYELYDTALSNAFKLARKDGYSLLFFKYGDGDKLHRPVDRSSKIIKVDAFKKEWITEINYKVVNDVKVFPVEIESYTVDTDLIYIDSEENKLHASRVEQIRTPGLTLKKEGVSVLKNPYDSLTVAKHIQWGAGQGFWRSGQGQVWVNAPPRASSTDLTTIDGSISNLNAKSAYVMPHGTEVKVTSPTALDPIKYQDTVVREISAASEIPKGKIIGSQPGEMASATADRQDYIELIVDWQRNIANKVLKRYFKRFIDSGALKYGGMFKIEWNSPEILTETEKMNIKWRDALIEQKQIQTGQLHPDEARAKNYPDKLPLTVAEKESLLQILRRSAL